MRKIKFVSLLVAFIGFAINVNAQSALASGGQLKLVGNQLSSECGNPIQLRGMSTHGFHWFLDCYNESSIETMRDDWGIDILRIASYVEPTSNGYVDNKEFFKQKIDEYVDICAEKQIYCIIDWHMLSSGNPLTYLDDAKEFFEYMADKHGSKKHVLFEICNEPNRNPGGSMVPWSDIKQYAEEIIPIIRNKAPESIIIVGTPSWSGNPWEVVGNELTGDNAHNVMYTFHFYAGSHSYKKDNFKNTISKIPLFVTEWGTSDASGNNNFSEAETRSWIDIFSGNNDEGTTISWCNWSFADKDETSAALAPGACSFSGWNRTSESGTLVKELLNTPDNFLSCTDEPQLITDLRDQVVNEGQEVTFKINVVGPDLNYTWYLNDNEITTAPNSSEYVIANADPSQDGQNYKVEVSNTEGTLTSRDALLTVFANGPFGGSPATIPGRIEAENYDIGAAGEAYEDNDAGNKGGVYRNDDVDISTNTDTDNSGFSVEWTENGEWLLYTVDVKEAGSYDFKFRTSKLGNDSKVSIETNNGFVIAGEVIPSTGSWSKWETYSIKNIELDAGEQEFKLYIASGPLNINYIDVIEHDPTSGIFDRSYDNLGISIYPNPTNGILNLSSDNISLSNAEIEVLDMTGVSILTTTGNSEINVSSLETGMYMLHISAGDKEVYLKWLKN